MKKIIWSTLIMASGVVFLQFSCSKSIKNRTDNIGLLMPAKTDIDAGSWKPVLLASATEFPVAAPAAVTSTGYVAELNEIKALQKNISADQEAKIAYWGAGGVLRWNELMRELVAKYKAKLAAGGSAKVSAVARGATLAALREHGWRLQTNPKFPGS